MKPWQKREFRKFNNEATLHWMIERGQAKTEDEAYELLKLMWKQATREFLPDGRIFIKCPCLQPYFSDNSS